MMKTLEEYLQNADYYLYDLNAERMEEEKTRIIEFCKTGDYEEMFRQQVISLPEWVALAERAKVKFLIEEPLKQNKGSKINAVIESGIFLRIYDQGKTPVIKVVI